MIRRSIHLDDSAVSTVVSCSACDWRVVSTDRIWARRMLVEHLDNAAHPREQTKVLRDTVKRSLQRIA